MHANPRHKDHEVAYFGIIECWLCTWRNSPTIEPSIGKSSLQRVVGLKEPPLVASLRQNSNYLGGGPLALDRKVQVDRVVVPDVHQKDIHSSSSLRDKASFHFTKGFLGIPRSDFGMFGSTGWGCCASRCAFCSSNFSTKAVIRLRSSRIKAASSPLPASEARVA